MHHTALAQGGRKEFCHGTQQSLMAIRHDQIDLRGPTLSQIV
jgi:hypothetical protein